MLTAPRRPDATSLRCSRSAEGFLLSRYPLQGRPAGRRRPITCSALSHPRSLPRPGSAGRDERRRRHPAPATSSSRAGSSSVTSRPSRAGRSRARVGRPKRRKAPSPEQRRPAEAGLQSLYGCCTSPRSLSDCPRKRKGTGRDRTAVPRVAGACLAPRPRCRRMQAPERSRTSARGVEARCSVR